MRSRTKESKLTLHAVVVFWLKQTKQRNTELALPQYHHKRELHLENLNFTCILYQLGQVDASLGVRTAEVELPVARTVEFHASVACEQESLALHKALSGPEAVDEWSKCLSQHFEVKAVEVYGAVLPKDPSSLATVKVRIPADKAEEFDKKSGVGCIVVRRWIPKGAS